MRWDMADPTTPPAASTDTIRFVGGKPESKSVDSSPPVAGSQNAGGPDAGGYSFLDSDEAGGPTFDWIEIDGTGTDAGLTDDTAVTVPLPFPFRFYGTTYGQLAIASNGAVYFSDTYLGYNNTCVPAANNYGVDAIIALYWDDLVPTAANKVLYQAVGAAPHRRFVVQWQNVAIYGTSGALTAQVQLFEESGEVLLLYHSLPAAAGLGATVGIQANPTAGLPYLCNAPGLHSGLAVSFAPCPTSYDVYLDAVDPPFMVICTGSAERACDPGPLQQGTTYYWRVVATNCCGSSESATWSFTTCSLPTAPAEPAPADGAATTSLEVELSWRTDPNPPSPLKPALSTDPLIPPDAQEVDAELRARPHEPIQQPQPVTRASPPEAAPRDSTPGPQHAHADEGLSLFFASAGVAPEGDTPMDVAFSTDGRRIIVAHRDSRNLIIFDAATRTVVDTIALSGSPNSLAISSDGVHAVTANLFENTASIVDLSTGAQTAVVPVGLQPGVVRITPDGSRAVVGNTLEGSLSVIDIASASELRRIPGAVFAETVTYVAETATTLSAYTDFQIAADNRTLMFPAYTEGLIQFYDIVDGTVSSLAHAAHPGSVAITPDGTRAVVGHGAPTNLVSVLDVPARGLLRTMHVNFSIDVSRYSIAINHQGTKAVVPVTAAAVLLDLTAGSFLTTLDTGCCLNLGVTFDGEYCFAGGLRGSLIRFATNSIVASLNNLQSTERSTVSPAGGRCASLSHTTTENLLVFRADGATGFLEGLVPSGPPPEADKTRTMALTPDGARAVAVNILSDNVSIVDMETLLVEAIVPVGDRPNGVQVSPDGRTAVVANLDSTFTTLVDLETHTAAPVTTAFRNSEVRISPDGAYAYVSVVSGGDGVLRINLATKTVEGPKVATGDMGGIPILFSPSSGIALSHDGRTLATCNSLSNNVSILNTESWSEVIRVPVGAFPVRAVFSPDDRHLYVSNFNDDSVSVVRNAGAASSVIGTITTGDGPFELVLAPDAAYLAVGNYHAKTISVVPLPAATVMTTIPLAGEPIGLSAGTRGDRFYAAVNGGDFLILDAHTHQIIDSVNTGAVPAMLVVHELRQMALMPSPVGADGLHVVSLGPGGPCPTSYDVQWGIVNPPLTTVCSGSRIPFCDPGPLIGSTTYYWQVVAHNCCGTVSGPVWSLETPEQPMLISAVSRRVHGASGEFDIPLPLGTGVDAGVESRREGPKQVVLTFSQPIQAQDGVLDTEVALSAGTLVSIHAAESTLTVDLANVPDRGCLAMSLHGLSNLSGIPLGGVDRLYVRCLYADVNGDGTVASGDVTQVKRRSGQMTTAENFRADVNADGVIASGDITQVKSRSGSSAPVCNP
ncbi:MAG: hypothetical protein AMXMBFR13_01800 [Phycisphaerae bacterium]